MNTRSSLKFSAIISFAAFFAMFGSAAQAQAVESNVPAAIRLNNPNLNLKELGLSDPAKEINITVHLKLNDKNAFDRAVDALYEPSSPTFHKWMTNADLRKYAPSEAQREAVRRELRKQGLTILSTDAIGFTVRAHGTLGNVERAFNTEIHEFARIGQPIGQPNDQQNDQQNGKTFRANVRNARLNGAAGDYVSTVAGLESHPVHPLYMRAVDPRTNKAFAPVPLKTQATGFPPGSTADCLSASATYKLKGSTKLPTAIYTGTVYSLNPNLICDFLPSQLQMALGLPAVYSAGYNGAGQTIVLVEGYGYPTLQADANEFYKLAGLPLLSKKNFSIVYPEGKPFPSAGIESGWNGEIALDMDSSHTIAPGASIVVVATNGQDSEDFQQSISYIAENNLGNSVSNSYEEDLDLFAGPLEQTSWDSTLEVATAKGISVNFSTGDGGDNGLGTPVGAPGVPSVAPHATAIGGTAILNDLSNPGSTLTLAWGDTLTYLDVSGVVQDPPYAYGLYGGGGGGESVYFPKPSWQSTLPGKGRQTPDVSALADPFTGFPIVITNGSQGQFVYYGVGGTSLASPIFTGFWALANQKAGSPLGSAAPLLASLPYGSLLDVLPTTDSTPNNVAGSVTDASGTTSYSASGLFSGYLYGNKGFTSTIWPLDAGDYYDVGFGIDSSLTVKKGWDNATGWGTPYGMTFINAVAKAAK